MYTLEETRQSNKRQRRLDAYKRRIPAIKERLNAGKVIDNDLRTLLKIIVLMEYDAEEWAEMAGNLTVMLSHTCEADDIPCFEPCDVCSAYPDCTIKTLPRRLP